MSWLWFLIIGAIAGAVAGRIVEGRGYGLLGNIVVGVIGSLVGGYLFDLLNIRVMLFGSLITATVGAIVLLLVVNYVRRR